VRSGGVKMKNKYWYIDLIFLLVIVVVCGIFVIGLETTSKSEPSVNVDCQHEWVVTSSYNWLMKSYRTYSKCSKCGQKI